VDTPALTLVLVCVGTSERFVQAYERKPDDNGDLSRTQLV
jgi:hypothetical protein